jgi:hypothetical protein
LNEGIHTLVLRSWSNGSFPSLCHKAGLGIPAEELTDFYKRHAKIIFPRWYLKILPRTARVFVNSIYSNKPLHKKLEEVFTKANALSKFVLPAAVGLSFTTEYRYFGIQRWKNNPSPV